MKRVVEVKAKDHTMKLNIKASVVTEYLTKRESSFKIETLTNKIHEVVREMGFDVREIQIV